MGEGVRFPIEAGHLLMFRRALGYPDSETSSEVPPTFPVASAQFDPEYRLRPRPGVPWFGSGGNPTGTPSGDGGGSSSLHAEQRFEYHRPIKEGETLVVTSEPGEAWEREGRAGTLRFSERITQYRDTDGNDVVTGRSVGVQVIPRGSA